MLVHSIAAKFGCKAETLRRWLRQVDCDAGARPGTITAERERIVALERDVRELSQAHEILRKASAHLPRRSSTYRRWKP